MASRNSSQRCEKKHLEMVGIDRFIAALKGRKHRLKFAELPRAKVMNLKRKVAAMEWVLIEYRINKAKELTCQPISSPACPPPV